MTAAQEAGQLQGPSSVVPSFTKGMSVVRAGASEGAGRLGAVLPACNPSHVLS